MSERDAYDTAAGRDLFWAVCGVTIREYESVEAMLADSDVREYVKDEVKEGYHFFRCAC